MIELAAVSKSFGANQVLRSVDLTVERSEVVCWIGPSGSGKSTLLRCVTSSSLTTPARCASTAGSSAIRMRPTACAGRLVGEISRHAARDRHGVPALQPLAAHDCAMEVPEPLRRGGVERARGGRAGDGDADCVGLAARPTLTLRVSRAASSSASPWPGCWPCSHGSCCSMSRPRRSIRTGRRSAGSDEEPCGRGHDDADRHHEWASPPTSPAGSPSSTRAASSTRARRAMCSMRARSRGCGSSWRPTTTGMRSEAC